MKKLYEESSKEIHDLKENISEIMTLLKNEKEGPRVSKNLEVSLTNNESTFNGIVSNDDLCVPPEVVTSHSTTSIMDSSLSVVKRTSEEGQSERDPHSISDLSTVTNHNSFNLDVDSAAFQLPVADQTQESSSQTVDQVKYSSEDSVDQAQVSCEEPVKRKSIPQEKNHNFESTQRMFIRRSFDVIKDVTGIFQSPMGIIYMMLFMMMFNVGVSKAANIPGQENFLSSNALTRLQPDQDLIMFDATSIDTMDFLFDLGEVNYGIHTGINSSCYAIDAMNKQCALHSENCQAAKLAIMNLESSIEKYLQTKYALQRVCNTGEVPSSKEIIRRCHAGEKWEGQFRGKRYVPSRAIPSGTATPEEDYTLSEEHVDEESLLERVRRFVISGAILIATAFGVASLASAAGTAAVIANNQAKKVLKKVQNHRSEDI